MVMEKNNKEGKMKKMKSRNELLKFMEWIQKKERRYPRTSDGQIVIGIFKIGNKSAQVRTDRAVLDFPLYVY